MKENIPYFAVGNDELEKKPPLGKTVRCRVCGEYHEVEYGKEKDPATGEMRESRLLAFYKCPKTGQLYLAGIDGREV